MKEKNWPLPLALFSSLHAYKYGTLRNTWQWWGHGACESTLQEDHEEKVGEECGQAWVCLGLILKRIWVPGGTVHEPGLPSVPSALGSLQALHATRRSRQTKAARTADEFGDRNRQEESVAHLGFAFTWKVTKESPLFILNQLLFLQRCERRKRSVFLQRDAYRLKSSVNTVLFWLHV